ncbi:MAG TPA: hypothetical protein VEA79_03065 [Phenylobacterium sp.]|nr:hypothetical protein [Phenylobacterium sp.]
MIPGRIVLLAIALAPAGALAQSLRDLQSYSAHLAACERDYQNRIVNQCGDGPRGVRCRDQMLQLSRNCVRNAEARLERARLRSIRRNSPPEY